MTLLWQTYNPNSESISWGDDDSISRRRSSFQPLLINSLPQLSSAITQFPAMDMRDVFVSPITDTFPFFTPQPSRLEGLHFTLFCLQQIDHNDIFPLHFLRSLLTSQKRRAYLPVGPDCRWLCDDYLGGFANNLSVDKRVLTREGWDIITKSRLIDKGILTLKQIYYQRPKGHEITAFKLVTQQRLSIMGPWENNLVRNLVTFL